MKQNKSFYPFSIIISILGIVSSYFLIILVNKLVSDAAIWLKGLVVLPVFVIVVGQIIRKFKS